MASSDIGGSARASSRRPMARGTIRPPRGPSKLRAVHGVGFSPGLAALAALLFVSLAVAAVLATGDRGPRLARGIREALDTRLASLGYRLGVVHLQGATEAARADIISAAKLPFGAPILTLDLPGLRARVERVGWVASARVIRLLPDTLVIAVVQRPLMAVWEHAGHAVVVASNGAILEHMNPADFPGLPLIVGPGANLAAADVLPRIAARPRLARRLQALVRVDGRRWDLRLGDGCQILLPAENVEAGLEKLDTLDRESNLLELRLARVDLRDPEMVIVRPAGLPPPPKTSGV